MATAFLMVSNICATVTDVFWNIYRHSCMNIRDVIIEIISKEVIGSWIISKKIMHHMV